MELLTKMVEHHVWLTGEMVRLAERLTDEQLDEPIELDVDDDQQTIRSLLSRLVGQMGMWNAALATRDYDWSVEEHESLSSMRERLAVEGPTYLAHVRDVVDQRPPRRHLRRRAVRAGRGLHVRRDDRARADLRRAPAHPGRARLRQARRRRARLGRPDALGRPARLTGVRRHNGRVELAFFLVAAGRPRPRGDGPGRPDGLPGAAAADRRGHRRSFVPGVPRGAPRARRGAARAAAAAALRGSGADLAGRLQRQPAADPAAVGRARRLHDRRRRLAGARAAAGRRLAGRVRDRCRGRAARRRRGDGDRPPDRAAAPDRRRSSRASRCSTTRPHSSRCAPRSRRPASASTALEVGVDFAVAAGGGVLVGLAVFIVVAWLRKRDHRPAARHRRSRSWRRSRRTSRRRRSTPPVSSRSSSPGCCSVTRRRSSRPRSPGSRSGSNWRTIAFMLENAVFLLIGLQARWILQDVAGQRGLGRPDRAGLRGHPGRRDRAPDRLGVLSTVSAGAAGAGPGDGLPAALAVHLPRRLGRHARRRHAGRGVRDPAETSSTARCCC